MPWPCVQAGESSGHGIKRWTGIGPKEFLEDHCRRHKVCGCGVYCCRHKVCGGGWVWLVPFVRSCVWALLARFVSVRGGLGVHTCDLWQGTA